METLLILDHDEAEMQVSIDQIKHVEVFIVRPSEGVDERLRHLKIKDKSQESLCGWWWWWYADKRYNIISQHLKPSKVEYKLEQREDGDVEVYDRVVPAHQVDGAGRAWVHLDVFPSSSHVPSGAEVLAACTCKILPWSGGAAT